VNTLVAGSVAKAVLRAFVFAAATFPVAGVLPAAPAFAQASREWRSCTGENNASAEQRISSCTAVIQSGRQTPHIPALAFYLRGTAYVQIGQHDRAIQDFDQTLRLDSDLAEVFLARGPPTLSSGGTGTARSRTTTKRSG
jgi:lipoprotein NlpI